MERQTPLRQSASGNHPDVLPGDGIVLEDSGKGLHNSQRCLVRLTEKARDGGDSKHPEDLSADLNRPMASHNVHNALVGFPKQHQEYARKILQVLATATPPSPDFYWVPDIGHFALYYHKVDTGFMIYVRADTGEFDVTISSKSNRRHHLITVPTLRQAQAICHTIAWLFRESIPGAPRRIVPPTLQNVKL